MVNENLNVAVTGMGALSILGKGIPEHREKLFAVSPEPPPYTPEQTEMIPLQYELTHYGKIMGFKLSRNSALALAAFEECLASSGWKIPELADKKVAFIMGTTAGCSSTDANYAHNFCLDRSPDPELYNNGIRQNPAGILKSFTGLGQADVFLINNACTSATDALGLGAKLLAQKNYDVVFAGGSDEVPFQASCGFGALQLVSPQHRCAPFDRSRDGLLLSEAASLVCLERSADFSARSQQKAQGYILGYETIAESFHQTGPHPEAEGLQYVTAKLLRKAGVSLSDLSFINAHATGTPSNDLSEGKFYSRFMAGIPVFATKGYTGHCLGAVGTLEAIFCLLAFQEKKLPKSLGFREVDPEILLTPTTALTPLTSQNPIAYSASVGFGGVNSALLLQGSAP